MLRGQHVADHELGPPTGALLGGHPCLRGRGHTSGVEQVGDALQRFAAADEQHDRPNRPGRDQPRPAPATPALPRGGKGRLRLDRRREPSRGLCGLSRGLCGLSRGLCGLSRGLCGRMPTRPPGRRMPTPRPGRWRVPTRRPGRRVLSRRSGRRRVLLILATPTTIGPGRDGVGAAASAGRARAAPGASARAAARPRPAGRVVHLRTPSGSPRAAGSTGPARRRPGTHP